MGKRGMLLIVAVFVWCLSFFSIQAGKTGDPAGGPEKPGEINEQDGLELLIERYKEYEARFSAIEKVSDIEENGFYSIEDQSFSVLLESFGEEEVIFLPIMDEKYNRMAVLIADRKGRVLYKTNQLETNNRRQGRLKQPTKGIAAVAFRDLNGDGLTDIILITGCENDTGEYAGKAYKTGDVLFQRDGGFYRDWRISDKINRFSMNKSIDCIVTYVRDGNSTEALYTASTLDELLDSGFRIIEQQSYYRSFEKQGVLRIVPGVIRLAHYDVFMIFLVNRHGDIVWSFQPMGDYESLYALKGMACRDVDGDGMKDIVVLARYSNAGPDGETIVDVICSIYYQRTDGFEEDRDFSSYHPCTAEDTVNGLVELIREYWGWTTKDD